MNLIRFFLRGSRAMMVATFAAALLSGAAIPGSASAISSASGISQRPVQRTHIP